MLASDPGRQIADVPTPDLIRCNGPEYIRPVYTGIHGIVSSTAWLISVHDKNLIQKQYKYLCLPDWYDHIWRQGCKLWRVAQLQYSQSFRF